MNKIKIQVKDKHIENGIPENCYLCAVALAIDEKLRSMFKLDFEPQIVKRENTGYALKLADNKPTPYQTKFETQISMEDQDTVDDFIFDFDNENEVQPFEFDIEINNFQIERMKKLEKEEKKLFDE
tara:strand:+ start:1114 stop:1491 length:378 start_codon:yes stop_codon:yes gene_type:complete